MSYCFGIDIGGTTVKMRIIYNRRCTSGKMGDQNPYRRKWKSNPSGCSRNDPEKNWKKKELKKTEVTGVGVGVPGPVVKEREVQVAVNLLLGIYHAGR